MYLVGSNLRCTKISYLALCSGNANIMPWAFSSRSPLRAVARLGARRTRCLGWEGSAKSSRTLRRVVVFRGGIVIALQEKVNKSTQIHKEKFGKIKVH